MSEVRSLFQKMLRYPGILPNGLPEFHYFVDEYLPTLKNNSANLLLYVTEDCARCHPEVLKRVVGLAMNGRSATRQDVHDTLLALARQPLDRSAAYLSVACLEGLTPLKLLEDNTRSIWKNMVDLGESEFVACMENLTREASSVSSEYPMSHETVLRLAAAISHLDNWQSRHPKSIVLSERIPEVVAKFTYPGRASVCAKQRMRPLVLGVLVITEWMKRVAVDLIPDESKALIRLHLQAVMAFPGLSTIRVHLSVMVMLLILSGRIPTELQSPNFQPCDLSDVPVEPRFYRMPGVALDRHTFRGKHAKNTHKYLEKHCEKRDLPLPANPEYSHGPSSSQTRQGFEEFMRHIQSCEEKNGQGFLPLFKEGAMKMYRLQPVRNRKRKFILAKTASSEESETRTKRSRRTDSDNVLTVETNYLEWIREHAPDDLKYQVQWEVLTLDTPIAQLPTGSKPRVMVDSKSRRVFKGPFGDPRTPLQIVALTKLAREVFDLTECVQDIRPFVCDAKKIGLVSPMIGENAQSSSTLSDNKERGLCKLHQYEPRKISSLVNAMDVLKIVTVKNLLQSSDNNSSNILVVEGEKKVYGLDFGGRMTEKQLTSQASRSVEGGTSFEWAFSKKPNKATLSQIDELVRSYAGKMCQWLDSFKAENARARYKNTRERFPVTVAPDDYIERLNLFLAFFKRVADSSRKV